MEENTYERGRFYIGPNGFPRFAGSSSGVYLTDTIRTELASGSHASNDVDIEQAFVHRNTDDLPRQETYDLYSQYLLRASDLVDEGTLREMITQYFTDWHPLFPFLDGAYLIQCFDNAVSMAKLNDMVSTMPSASSSSTFVRPPSPMAFEGLTPHEALVLSTILRAIFSLGINTSAGPTLTPLPTFQTPTQTTMLAHLIISANEQSTITDVFALQGLLAIQLYLFVMRKPRPAMHLTGISIKLAYEAGLHRCPSRFSDTFKTASERDLRKRVFYSLYVLDRLLSAEFGIPLMLADSDVDTCLPGGEEKHALGGFSPVHPARTPREEHMGTPGTDNTSLRNLDRDSVRNGKRRRVGDEVAASPSEHRNSPHSVPAAAPAPQREERTVEEEVARKRLLPAISLIHMARMIGRAMETFNKSIKHRAVNSNEALALRADLDRWWNDIGLDCGEEIEDPRHHFATLFTCLYHQQIINLNRPLLSVSPTKMQHVAALQTTVSSVRVICSHLSVGLAPGLALQSSPSSLYWPGYVDMVFFGSLLLVYAQRLDGSHLGESGSRLPGQRLHRDLSRIIIILEKLCDRWNNLSKFTRIVTSFINSADPQPTAQIPSTSFNNPTQPTDPFDTTWNWAGGNDLAMDGAAVGEFYFGFEGFDLNPESNWAYQRSMPASPVR